MLLTLQLKLRIKKGHTPSITTVTITVYLKENGNKKNEKGIAVVGGTSIVRVPSNQIRCVILNSRKMFHFQKYKNERRLKSRVRTIF